MEQPGYYWARFEQAVDGHEVVLVHRTYQAPDYMAVKRMGKAEQYTLSQFSEWSGPLVY